MRHRKFILGVTGAVLAIGGTNLVYANTIRVPGTKVRLEPPIGFSLADRFPGFQCAELGASIMVTEMPAPGKELMKGMTKAGLASRGMTLISSKTESLNGREALLLYRARVYCNHKGTRASLRVPPRHI